MLDKNLKENKIVPQRRASFSNFNCIEEKTELEEDDADPEDRVAKFKG